MWPSVQASQIEARLAGRWLLPWEDPQPHARAALGDLWPSVACLLHRDPTQRPPIAEVVQIWHAFFASGVPPGGDEAAPAARVERPLGREM
jgi:hypothetical protein